LLIREACVGSLREALKAQSLGADRIEYCQNLHEGGTTPSYGSILEAKKLLSIPMMVIIRPRGGDFVYSQEEVNSMIKDIELCKKVGVQGVVLGVLTKNGVIDKLLLNELVDVAKPLDITFHMAFDSIKNKEKALEELIELKVDRILTKGCDTNAFDGKNEIKKLIDQSSGRITIIPGGGIREDNFQAIVDFTGAKEVHGTEIVGYLS
jgi:copper homeostasis protein